MHADSYDVIFCVGFVKHETFVTNL